MPLTFTRHFKVRHWIEKEPVVHFLMLFRTCKRHIPREFHVPFSETFWMESIRTERALFLQLNLRAVLRDSLQEHVEEHARRVDEPSDEFREQPVP